MNLMKVFEVQKKILTKDFSLEIDLNKNLEILKLNLTKLFYTSTKARTSLLRIKTISITYHDKNY